MPGLFTQQDERGTSQAAVGIHFADLPSASRVLRWLVLSSRDE